MPTRAPFGSEALPLAGLNVLLLEDNYLQAADLATGLQGLGAHIIGPFSNLEDGWVGAVSGARVDAAVLDLKLGEQMVYPLLAALCDARTPVLLVSGYGREILPERYEALPLLTKPCDPSTVARELAALVEASRRRSLPG